MYHSDVSLTRAEAAPVLVQALSKAKGQLDAKTAQIARRAVLQALRDPKEVVRINTVEALGDVGGEDMIPALKEVVEKDNSPDVSGHSIRKRAAEAIAAIQKRVGQQQN
jgi:HEAT repeat protein